MSIFSATCKEVIVVSLIHDVFVDNSDTCYVREKGTSSDEKGGCWDRESQGVHQSK